MCLPKAPYREQRARRRGAYLSYTTHRPRGHHLHELDGQGWDQGYLEAAFLELLRTGDPARQQELLRKVEELMSGRGFGFVIDAWGLDIEWVKGLQVQQ